MIISIQNTSKSLALLAEQCYIDKKRPIPKIELIRESDHRKHCFSVCLYREKTYAQRFPDRDFHERYLSQRGQIERFIDRTKTCYRIFVDEEMLDTALKFKSAEVYLVHDKPDFPFQQHIWRYYSVLFPDSEIIGHHFRGLDNLNDDKISFIDEFVNGYDLLCAPYFAGTLINKGIIPIRGSCSVANNGIKLLRDYLKVNRPKQPEGNSKRLFHNDELFLRDWWNQDKDKMSLYIYLDRILKQSELFYEILNRIRSGLKTNIKINVDPNGPMRSRKKK